MGKKGLIIVGVVLGIVAVSMLVLAFGSFAYAGEKVHPLAPSAQPGEFVATVAFPQSLPLQYSACSFAGKVISDSKVEITGTDCPDGKIPATAGGTTIIRGDKAPLQLPVTVKDDKITMLDRTYSISYK